MVPSHAGRLRLARRCPPGVAQAHSGVKQSVWVDKADVRGRNDPSRSVLRTHSEPLVHFLPIVGHLEIAMGCQRSKRAVRIGRMIVGYARTSANDESSIRLQDVALRAAGCESIYVDRGAGHRLPQLSRALSVLSRSDVLVVRKLDRLGRGLADVIGLLRAIAARGAHLRSLDDAIDTTTAAGTALFRLIGAIDEADRLQRGERALGGVRAAKQRGQRLGRPPKLTPSQVRAADKRILAGEGLADVAGSLNVSALTLRRAFKAQREGQLQRRCS